MGVTFREGGLRALRCVAGVAREVKGHPREIPVEAGRGFACSSNKPNTEVIKL